MFFRFKDHWSGHVAFCSNAMLYFAMLSTNSYLPAALVAAITAIGLWFLRRIFLEYDKIVAKQVALKLIHGLR